MKKHPKLALRRETVSALDRVRGAALPSGISCLCSQAYTNCYTDGRLCVPFPGGSTTSPSNH